MVLRIWLCCCFYCFGLSVFSQSDTSSSSLENVTVTAYGHQTKLKEVAASVGYVSKSVLQSSGTFSVVTAMNTIPGIRMEERSPGSYRLNFRGSSVRSPFGVRNVKVYYNDIPLTDPTGQTYLNQLGFYNISDVTIVKGPAGSMYGAGTGGALLINSISKSDSGIVAAYSFGSYQAHQFYVSNTNVSELQMTKVGLQYQQSDGYRNHSALKRTVFSFNGNYSLRSKAVLKTVLLLGDLRYQTPGALTKAEYDANPAQSRPATASFPSAEQNNASIHQQMLLMGLSFEQPINQYLSNKTVLYGIYSELKNPAIQNYGHNVEPHTGFRTLFDYKKKQIHIIAGMELQQGFATLRAYKNVNGNADSLRYADQINNRQLMMFAQGSFEHKKWMFTAGFSYNRLDIHFERNANISTIKGNAGFTNQIAPRFSFLYKLNKLNVYTAVSKGFSPPTLSELLPTGGTVNTGLNAEQGLNYEAGVKGNPAKNLFIDIKAFIFQLNNTIVQRRTAGGSDYYINAGKTNQKGVELLLNYYTSAIQYRFAYTLHDFSYQDFKQNSNDFSGNKMPSVPLHTVAFGTDIQLNKSWNISLQYYYSDAIMLNDANTAVADAYHLLGGKISYIAIKSKQQYRFSAGVDNLLNQRYSLGNDVNAFGGRYYNAAMPVNYYASVTLQLN